MKGNAAVYLSPSSVKAPTLALRAGGQPTFGRYPYFEAAYLGGGLGGFGASAGARSEGKNAVYVLAGFAF